METSTPFNLDLTINSGHSSFPAPEMLNNEYPFLISLNSDYFPVLVSQISSNTFQIITYLNNSHINRPHLSQEISDKLKSILGFNENLNDFYSNCVDSKIKRSLERYKGMSLTKPLDYFESLVCSILTQNCSVEQWMNVARSIKKRFGEEIQPLKLYTFLSPERLCRQDEGCIRDCKAGYRAPYLQHCARIVIENPQFFNQLKSMPRLKAKQELRKIKGIGEKVANMFLLYGLGFKDAVPVDRWISRIVSKLYFSGQQLKPQEVEDFFSENFGNWSGLAQIYLFHGARTGVL